MKRMFKENSPRPRPGGGSNPRPRGTPAPFMPSRIVTGNTSDAIPIDTLRRRRAEAEETPSPVASRGLDDESTPPVLAPVAVPPPEPAFGNHPLKVDVGTPQSGGSTIAVVAMVLGMMVMAALVLTLAVVGVVMLPEQLIVEPVVEPEPDIKVALYDDDVVFPDIAVTQPRVIVQPKKDNVGPTLETKVEVVAPAVGPAPATVILAKGSPPYRSIEVQCGDTYRERASFSGGKATLPSVPREKCRLTVQGGPPGRNDIQGGETKVCTMDTTLVCRLQ